MTHAALSPDIGREFDPFLFASVGEDRHGQLLSVISVLARSDFALRLEARALARMSQWQATSRRNLGAGAVRSRSSAGGRRSRADVAGPGNGPTLPRSRGFAAVSPVGSSS